MQRVNIQDAVILRVILNAMDCPTCGCVFAVTEEFEGRRRKDGLCFYCPSGHSITYSGTRDDELRETKTALQSARAKIMALEGEKHRLVNDLLDKVKESKRVEKRIHAGVCPYCHRHFVALERHVANKHGSPEQRSTEKKLAIDKTVLC